MVYLCMDGCVCENMHGCVCICRTFNIVGISHCQTHGQSLKLPKAKRRLFYALHVSSLVVPPCRSPLPASVHRFLAASAACSFYVQGLQVASSHMHVQGRTSFAPVPMVVMTASISG
jgi:nitric oxide reductase large subunit